MYFTLLFQNQPEGPALTYNLVFHPGPVWMKSILDDSTYEEKQIVVPNPSTPVYEKGHLKILFEKEKIDKEKLSTKVAVVCYEEGHGTEEDRKTILEDLESEGFDVEIFYHNWKQRDPPDVREASRTRSLNLASKLRKK